MNQQLSGIESKTSMTRLPSSVNIYHNSRARLITRTCRIPGTLVLIWDLMASEQQLDPPLAFLQVYSKVSNSLPIEMANTHKLPFYGALKKKVLEGAIRPHSEATLSSSNSSRGFKWPLWKVLRPSAEPLRMILDSTVNFTTKYLRAFLFWELVKPEDQMLTTITLISLSNNIQII